MRKTTGALLAVALAGTALTVVATRAEAAGGFDFTRPEVVATGLEVPWGVAFLPDGSALVAERMRARIMRVRPGAAPVQVATVPNVSPAGEGGLLGLAVSPTYAQDNLVYAYFTSATDNRIVRFTLANAQNQQVIVSGIPRASIHDGGRLAFGPDGMLYASTGDAGQSANAQNTQSLGGKILRMTPTGGVPSGNPFGNLVYSLGHRHVQGLAWDAQGRLWATEFGQNTWDEINLIVAGGNYGWPTVEGMGNNTNFRNPLVVWTTAESSPSGLAQANNTLFAGALRGTRLWLVPLTGDGGVGTPTVELQGTFGRLRTVILGPDGYLWVTTSNRDGRGTPAASDDRVIRFPPSGGVNPSPSGSPTTGSPSPSPSVSPTGSVAPGACSVGYELNQWSNGFTANVTVTNRGAALNGWTLNWTFPGNQQVANSWNTQLTQSGQAVTARNVGWNASLPSNGSVTFGFQATYSGSNGRPTDFRLGSAACTAG
jgi:glucose/arabinose dehydrogenase